MPRKKSAAKRAREQAKKEAAVPATDTATIKTSETSATTVKPAIEASKSYVPSEDEEEDEEEEEEEDDYGELITDEVENGINQVLDAIKNNKTDKLLDPKVKFFEDPESAAAKLANREGKHKPIYLKDYHRMNVLSGDALKEDDEEYEHATVDGKQSFVSQQREEKTQLLNEIKSAFNDEENEESSGDEDDGFLKKKEPSTKKEGKNLPDPTVNEENFLEEFVNQQAWIPKKGDKVISLDLNNNEEDDEEFEDAAEKFENAYNFRYEDPNAAEIISYARSQATLRRSDDSSRRRKREEKRKIKEQIKAEKETALQKKKTKKLNKLTDILEQLTKEYGAEINADMVKKITDTLLKNDFKEEEWDNVVAELFNEEFYQQEGKPTWNEDDEIMGDFYADADGDDQAEEGEVEKEQKEEDEEEGPKRKKSKKEEKLQKKKEKRKVNELVENALEQNKLALIEEVEKEEEERKSRSRTKEEQDLKFRYREVSPESFGLTAREIFAADDTDLNELIGLKKFAPYRSKELRAKDKRKVMKARRLREWRKKTFKNENGLAPVEAEAGEKDEDTILIPVEKASKSKHKKGHSHKHKGHQKK
ncbi:AMM_1a_G0043900.mRNA.1.CDS.1 [Saccharomyces cerevisiae]|nr:AMM_1a_G0043900.mRNA.1.CDS.1 [Saccharomyces cerevisiae]CAI6852434.1 AMM_1a_G0043900.mRNA.1.CDS.1 [Saccharomyces cerevisiae]